MLTYIQQNGSLGKSIAYKSKSHPSATIATSGCGVCSSLMVLLNSASYDISLKKWADILIKNGARADSGTDMSVVGRLLENKYGFEYTHTTDVETLKKHIKAGYKAVAHVGNKGYFSSGGHYVCVAGITSDGKAIVLDPYYYTNKWKSTVKGINRTNHFTYNSSTHEVYCSFNVIAADSRGLKYYLFKPKKKVKLAYSTKDPKSVKKNSYAKWTGIVTASLLNVREQPNTKCKILGTLKRGTKVTITGESGKFYKLSYNGKTAYLSKSYVGKSAR